MEALSCVFRIASLVIPVSLLYFFLKKSRRKSPLALQGKVVVVTGASSGLGASCAKLFHEIGCRVVLCGRNVDVLNETAKTLASSSSSANPFIHFYNPKCVQLDLANLSTIPASAKKILEAFGTVDILINNAGISYRGEIETTDIDVDVKIMTVNYFGQVALTKALLSHLLRKDEVDPSTAHIVAISSVQGKISIPFRSAYAASKHALQSFFDCLRAEVSGTPLSIHVLSPGYIKTNLSLNAMTGDGTNYGIIDDNTAQGMSPDQVAEEVLEMILKDKPDIVLARLKIRVAVYLRALIPALYFSLMGKRAIKQRSSTK